MTSTKANRRTGGLGRVGARGEAAGRPVLIFAPARNVVPPPARPPARSFLVTRSTNAGLLFQLFQTSEQKIPISIRGPPAE